MAGEGPGPEPGTYLLVLRVEAACRPRVGALGAVELAPGRHAYAGSALGPGGVRARMARHLRGEGARHWHVDHLREAARPTGAWWVHAEERLECRWAEATAGLSGADRSAPGFGASDCGCPGHLVRLPEGAAGGALRAALAGASPRGADLRRADADRLRGAGENGGEGGADRGPRGA